MITHHEPGRKGEEIDVFTIGGEFDGTTDTCACRDSITDLGHVRIIELDRFIRTNNIEDHEIAISIHTGSSGGAAQGVCQFGNTLARGMVDLVQAVVTGSEDDIAIVISCQATACGGQRVGNTTNRDRPDG